VPSVMNADPRHYPEAQPLPELNYAEVIEMAYNGAQGRSFTRKPSSRCRTRIFLCR